MLTTQQILDYLKVGLGSATEVSDELLRQFTNYLIVSTLLHAAVVALIFAFLYSSISKVIRTLSDDRVSQVWSAIFKTARVVLTVGTILYMYDGVNQVLEPLMAPHVWLAKQGIQLLKK